MECNIANSDVKIRELVVTCMTTVHKWASKALHLIPLVQMVNILVVAASRGIAGHQTSGTDPASQIQVIEIFKAPYITLAIKDLTQTCFSTQSIAASEFHTALPKAVKHLGKTGIQELHDMMLNHPVAAAGKIQVLIHPSMIESNFFLHIEHQHSSRTTVLITMEQRNSCTTVIDPPGQESPTIETQSSSGGSTTAITQGTQINKTFGQLQEFIEVCLLPNLIQELKFLRLECCLLF